MDFTVTLKKNRDCMSLEELFETIWNQYSDLNPQAKKIHDLLGAKEKKILNDHVAYRSVNLPDFGIDKLKKPFLDEGYKACGKYNFKNKKLRAIHLEHENKNLPKVFISELLLEKLSENTQKLYKNILKNVVLPSGKKVLTCGRLWKIDYKSYQELYKESEYAAWLAAFGYCANHFTININKLTNFKSIKDLNQFLEDSGYILNSNGGKIKGSKNIYLEQSSTMAGKFEVKFTDCIKKIPSCYYEFAKRYKMESGQLYQGFVQDSADKIFESTNNPFNSTKKSK